MTRDRKIRRLANSLVEMSKEDGLVSETCVGEVLAALRESAPRHHLRILKTYLAVLRREVAAQSAVVHSAGSLTPETLAALEAGLSERYGRPVKARVESDPALIAGVRVRVGDDLFDGSISGRLARLAEFVR